MTSKVKWNGKIYHVHLDHINGTHLRDIDTNKPVAKWDEKAKKYVSIQQSKGSESHENDKDGSGSSETTNKSPFSKP